MSLSAACVGRVISLHLDITLTPPQGGELGDTDAAWDIGSKLVGSTVLALKLACEDAGFVVDVNSKQIVY